MSEVSEPIALQTPPKYYSLRVLFAAHCILTLCIPFTALFVPGEYESVQEAIDSILIGQLMLLGFWTGFGVSNTSGELVAILLASTYLPLMGAITFTVRSLDVAGLVEALLALVTVFACFLVLLALLVIALVVMRARGAALRWFPAPKVVDAQHTWRFSIRQLFVFTLIAAVFLATARLAELSADSAGPLIVFLGLFAVAVLLDALLPIWATMSPGRTWPRIALALAVTLFTGAVLATRDPEIGSDPWLAFVDSATILPGMAVFVGSLYVVRACGYRVVGRVGQALRA